MEQIGHLQWTIGIILILTWVFHNPLSGVEIFLLGWIALFPDLLDLLWGKQAFNTRHRYLTHGIFFLMFWYMLGYLTASRLIYLVAIGSTCHIAEDLLAGGSEINLLSPLTTDFGKVMLVSKEHQNNLGRFVKNSLTKYILGTESLSDDLAFFWLITMIGTSLFVIGVGLYLL